MLSNNSNYQIAKQVMDVAHMRHQALASNIANFENPGYKRIDVAKSFAEEFRNAAQEGDVERIQKLTPTLQVDNSRLPMRADGNNVSIEGELLQMNKNSLEFDFAQQLVSSSIRRLQTAIKGHIS